jgi:hypothetical protein
MACSFVPQPPSGSTYDLRCFLAGELLANQFPSSQEVLDDAILSAIQGVSINTKVIVSLLEQAGTTATKKEINSRLYTMLSKGLVRRQLPSLSSKAPLWSLA